MATTADDVWKILAELATAQKETDRQLQQTNDQLQQTDRQLLRRVFINMLIVKNYLC